MGAILDDAIGASSRGGSRPAYWLIAARFHGRPFSLGRVKGEEQTPFTCPPLFRGRPADKAATFPHPALEHRPINLKVFNPPQF